MAETTKHVIHKLLHYALIDLRAEGHTTHDDLVFRLADLFHNVPLQLDLVDRGKISPDDVMQWMRSRVSGTMMEAWLHLRMGEFAKDERRESTPGGEGS